MDFEGRTVIVTGAGKGLGRAFAESFAAHGASVVVNNRVHADDEVHSADQVVAAIEARGGVAVADFQAVDEPGAGERIVATALEAFGRIDVIVANAGVSEPIAFHRESMDHVRHILDVNLVGAVDLVHAALPHLRRQAYGRVAVITSSAALYGDAGFVSYATAKAALIGFVSALAQESRRSGVLVHALVPFARTPMTTELFDNGAFGAVDIDELGPGPVARLLLWLMHESCQESGRVWIAGGRVVQTARTVVTRGITVDPSVVDPAELARRSGEISDDSSTRSFADGAELLRSIIAASAGPPTERTRRAGPSAAPRVGDDPRSS